MVVYVTFLRDVACQKLLNSAYVSRSYSQNNTGRHGVYKATLTLARFLIPQNGQCVECVEARPIADLG